MTAAARVRVPVIYRPGSAVFWVYVAAVVLGATVLLAQQGAAIRETLNANLMLTPLWVGFVAFMVWLMTRFDPFRALRPYPQALVAATCKPCVSAGHASGPRQRATTLLT